MNTFPFRCGHCGPCSECPAFGIWTNGHSGSQRPCWPRAPSRSQWESFEYPYFFSFRLANLASPFGRGAAVGGGEGALSVSCAASSPRGRASYAAASSIFSMKIPYPVVGSLTRTWVTAPTSLPSCIIGEPDTLMSSRGQKKFAEKLRFYPKYTQKRRFLHRSTRIPQLTQMKCRKYRILRLLAFSTNSDFGGNASVCPHNGQFIRPPEPPEALQILIKYRSCVNCDPGTASVRCPMWYVHLCSRGFYDLRAFLRFPSAWFSLRQHTWDKYRFAFRIPINTTAGKYRSI